VAAGLGIDEATIFGLEARGHLERLALTEAEIRERLYRAHLAYARERDSSGRPRPGEDVERGGADNHSPQRQAASFD
jgi:hypothetical protein